MHSTFRSDRAPDRVNDASSRLRFHLSQRGPSVHQRAGGSLKSRLIFPEPKIPSPKCTLCPHREIPFWGCKLRRALSHQQRPGDLAASHPCPKPRASWTASSDACAVYWKTEATAKLEKNTVSTGSFPLWLCFLPPRPSYATGRPRHELQFVSMRKRHHLGFRFK